MTIWIYQGASSSRVYRVVITSNVAKTSEKILRACAPAGKGKDYTELKSIGGGPKVDGKGFLMKGKCTDL